MMVKPSTKEHYVLKVYKHWATYISKHRLGFKSKYYLTKSRKVIVHKVLRKEVSINFSFSLRLRMKSYSSIIHDSV